MSKKETRIHFWYLGLILYQISGFFLEGQFSGKKECDRILTVGKNVIGLNLKKGGHLLPFFVELMLDF